MNQLDRPQRLSPYERSLSGSQRELNLSTILMAFGGLVVLTLVVVLVFLIAPGKTVNSSTTVNEYYSQSLPSIPRWASTAAASTPVVAVDPLNSSLSSTGPSATSLPVSSSLFNPHPLFKADAATGDSTIIEHSANDNGN